MNSVSKLVKSWNVMRETYNPLRGLTIARAVSLLESMQTGAMTDLQWTYLFIEETDPDLLALVERRVGAIEEMDYDIKTASEEKNPRTFDEKLAEEQRVALAAGYEQIDNLYEALAHLATATFRRYAHAQVHTNTDGAPAHLEVLPQYNWVRKGLTGAWYWNPEARTLNWQQCGEPIEDPYVIVREVPRHVNRYALLKFVREGLSDKDWDAFIEIYGIPMWAVIGPQDVGSDEDGKFAEAAERFRQGDGGYLPFGSTVVTPDGIRTNAPFQPRLEWLQRKLVLAGTGGMLTMLAESGSGTLAGSAHMQAFKLLARAEARRISELLQKTLDRIILDLEFPGKPRLAYFSLAANEEQNIGEVCDHAVKLFQAGYTIDQADIEEQTGYTLHPAPAAPAATELRNRLAAHNRAEAGQAGRTQLADRTQAQLVDASLELALEAERRDLRPLAERLYAILAIEDGAAMMAALRKLQADLPELATVLLESPELATVWEGALGAGAANGLIEGALDRRKPGGQA